MAWGAAMRNSKHQPNPQTDTQRTRRAIRRRLAGTPAARVAKDIRAGDEWAFLTNSGYLTRRVTAVEDGKVFYRGPGEIRDRQCSMATFQRWVKGARLDFATDWSGRDAPGVEGRTK
jgi:hypothetical protein